MGRRATYLDVTGVTIQDGQAAPTVDSGSGGGGGIANNEGGTVTVSDVTFSNNRAGSGDDGGAIDNADANSDGLSGTGSVTVTNSQFTDNSAANGARSTTATTTERAR